MLGEIAGIMPGAEGAGAAAAAAAPALLLSAGLAAGLVHALDPDHVAAVLASGHGRRGGGGSGGAGAAGPSASAASRARGALSRGSLLGALWGAGHTSAILLVGIAVLAFSLSIPGEVLAGLEAGVGLMLVALGVSAWTGTGLLGLWRRGLRRGGARARPHSHGGGTVHTHPHSHGGGTVHTHPHSHPAGEEEEGGGEGGAPHRHGHRSYLIGCVHGLAGGGGMVALSASAMESMQAGVALILAFGAGSVAGMMVASGMLSLPLALAARLGGAGRAMRAVVGAASVAIGIAVVSGVALGAAGGAGGAQF